MREISMTLRASGIVGRIASVRIANNACCLLVANEILQRIRCSICML